MRSLEQLAAQLGVESLEYSQEQEQVGTELVNYYIAQFTIADPSEELLALLSEITGQEWKLSEEKSDVFDGISICYRKELGIWTLRFTERATEPQPGLLPEAM